MKSNNIMVITVCILSVVLFLPLESSGFDVHPMEVSKIAVPEFNTLPENFEAKYWENGNIRLLKEYNDLGRVVGEAYFRGDGSLEQEKTFDNRGNKYTLAYFNSRGGLRTGPDGWAAIIWKYNNGVMRGQGYYDSSGKITRYKIYNASGDLVSKQYFGDEEPDLNELYSTNSTTRAPQSFEFYDSNGKPQGKVTAYKSDYMFPHDYPYWHYGRHPCGSRYRYDRRYEEYED